MGPYRSTPVMSLLFLPTSDVPVLVVGSGAGDIGIIKYPSSSQPEVISLTKYDSKNQELHIDLAIEIMQKI